MGYTHYFTFKKTKGNAADIEKRYQKAIKDCQKIVKSYYRENKGTSASLSGYTAHSAVGQYGGVEVNGKGENGHETFILREHFNQNFEEFGEGFNFCKTAYKPYDVVVVACLAVLKHRLGDAVDVSSDGQRSDWVDGTKLACQVTRLKVNNPIVDDNPKLELLEV